MDWIMEIPPEVITGFWIAIGGLVSAIGALIVAIVTGARRIVEAQAARQEADLKADKKREDMINNFAVEWEKRLEEKTIQLTDLQEKQRQSEVGLAEERGKVVILQDTIKHDRESRQKERQELLDKIDELEKRIAELEHENQSKDELLVRKDELIKSLIKERDEAITSLEALNTKYLAVVIDLNEAKEKLDDCEDKDKPQDDKIKELVQPKTDNEKSEDIA